MCSVILKQFTIGFVQSISYSEYQSIHRVNSTMNFKIVKPNSRFCHFPYMVSTPFGPSFITDGNHIVLWTCLTTSDESKWNKYQSGNRGWWSHLPALLCLNTNSEAKFLILSLLPWQGDNISGFVTDLNPNILRTYCPFNINCRRNQMFHCFLQLLWHIPDLSVQIRVPILRKWLRIDLNY